MIGYDMDGVIAWEGKVLDLCFLLSPKLGVLVRDRSMLVPPLYDVVDVGAIVTGRPECDRQTTERWLARHCIPHTALYMSNTFSTIKAITHKAKTIDDLGITLFVESDEHQAELIQRLCPSTRVLLPSDALYIGYIKLRTTE